jgi:hypothetical protein
MRLNQSAVERVINWDVKPGDAVSDDRVTLKLRHR